MSAWRRVGLWGPVGAFMVGVWILSSPEDLALVPHVWDKLLHATAYGLFGFFCQRACHGGVPSGGLRRSAILGGLALTVGYGIVDEGHQAWIPGRDSSVADVGADVVGALVGLAAIWGVTAWRRARRARHDERATR